MCSLLYPSRYCTGVTCQVRSSARSGARGASLSGRGAPAGPPRRQATAECAPGDHYDRPRSGWERLCVTGCTGQPLIGCSGHRTHAVATLWVLAGRSVHRAQTPGGAAALRPPHSRRSRLPCFGADSAAVVVLSAVGGEGSRRRPRRGCVAQGLGERGARGGARSRRGRSDADRHRRATVALDGTGVLRAGPARPTGHLHRADLRLRHTRYGAGMPVGV